MARLLRIGRFMNFFGQSFVTKRWNSLSTTASRDKQFIVGTYARIPISLTHGNGVTLYSEDGQAYLDFYAGIAVNSLGHNHPEVTAVIREQASKLIHISNMYYTVPQVDLAQRLVESSAFDKVYFCNSGTEANEGAIKFVRKYAYVTTGATEEKPNRKTKIIACNGSFHGRTVGSLSLTYKKQYKMPFLPLLQDVEFIDFNDVEAVKKAVDENTCAVIVEPIQGEGGVFPASREFLRVIRERTRAVNALMIVDEVQCGLGRTGSLWAHQEYGVEPDIMTTAKPLANGLPIGAVLVTQRVADVLKPGDHGSTFAGGPLVTAVANRVVEIIDTSDFLAGVKARGRLFYKLLNELKEKLAKTNTAEQVQVRDIRSLNGESLLVGLELNSVVGKIIEDIVEQHKILVISGGTHVLRFCPPLVIGDEDVRRLVRALEQVLIGRAAVQA